jgi:predicted ATPase/class 3 adenylate cyclase
MLVVRLRRKIEPDPAKARFIITVPGTGYKFAAHVRRMDSVPEPIANIIHPDRAHRDTHIAERRQLTVLACQILGFAALSELDPEDLQRVLNRIHGACAEVVTRFRGTMVRAVGDSMLVYFGYPEAYENDAESAVRAGLNLLHSIGKLEVPSIQRLRARIGIATGLMVVGDVSIVGGQEPNAVGEALNVALHLQSAAPAGSTVIAASTRELVGHFFDCQQLEPVVVEDGHDPLPAWRVAGEGTTVGRFEALRRSGMLKLVGREEELERLHRGWSNARRGSGQVVLLTGEAGIGKSRLVIELEERLRSEPHATLRYSGSPYQSDAPMSALLEELQRSAGFVSEDSVPQRLRKLRTLLEGSGSDAVEATALLAELLGLPAEAEPSVPQLAPQKRKERTFATLLARIECMAARQQLLIITEDVQWVDPTSLELLTLLVERMARLPIFVIVVARPGFIPPWPDHSYVTAFTLSRLSRADCMALIEQLAGDRPLSVHTKSQILAQTDGMPLFVEELTKSVIERSMVRERHGRQGPTKSNGVQAMPKTLHASLLARLDRLGRGKETAQVGAAIGREFSYELLRMVTTTDEPTLGTRLDQLVASGLVFRRGPAAHATYAFKHALVRDAAYGMLPRAQRRKLHASIARSLEEHFPETAETQPELVAYHCREAGSVDKAVGYLLAAAERALLRSAMTEALVHLTQAKDLVSTLPESKERWQLELKLEITLGRVLTARRSYTAPETREAYRRARARCEALGHQAWLPLIMLGQWVGAWSAADHRPSLKLAQELYGWGERNNDRGGMAVAHLAYGMTLTLLGDLVRARLHLEQALQINEFGAPGRHPFLFSDTDGRISSLTYLHDCLLLLGFPHQAEAAARQAAALTPSQLYSRALAQIHMLRMHVFDRDVEKAATVSSALLRLSEEQGYPYFIGASMVYRGWALAQGGDTANGIELCHRGMTQLRTIGANCWFPRYYALLAECHEQAGDPERGGEAIAEAQRSIESTGERIWEAEILRLKGRLLLLAGNHGREAETCFVAAVTTAHQQKARLLELRAATSLADLLQRKGNLTQARDVLVRIYETFKEGFDCADLQNAKALLDALSTRSQPRSKPRRAKDGRG